MIFRTRESTHPAGGSIVDDALESGPDKPRDLQVTYSPLARAGHFIYRHRALFLLPELLVPIVLLNNPHILSFPWRLASYGLALLGAGLRLRCTGYRTWTHKSSGSRHLMTAGPYGRLRHPLYIANFLIFLPLFLVANVWWITLLFAAWYFLTHHAIIVREDEVLLARYGADWEDYAAKVRRFLPKLRAYEPCRGEFLLEPILRGREPLQLGAWFALLLLFEIFRTRAVELLDSLHAFLGLSVF
jgi:protein-S-isoprenylcysteine O-methyltransferase Ste14